MLSVAMQREQHFGRPSITGLMTVAAAAVAAAEASEAASTVSSESEPASASATTQATAATEATTRAITPMRRVQLASAKNKNKSKTKPTKNQSTAERTSSTGNTVDTVDAAKKAPTKNQSTNNNTNSNSNDDDSKNSQISGARKRLNIVPPATEGLDRFNSNDVLSGRGGGTNLHPGNRYYRDLIYSSRTSYEQSTKARKPHVAKTIVQSIREQGGRFLRKDSHDGLYYEIGDIAAREKTSQALRHRTFEMRRKEEADRMRALIKKRDAEWFAARDKSPTAAANGAANGAAKAGANKQRKRSVAAPTGGEAAAVSNHRKRPITPSAGPSTSPHAGSTKRTKLDAQAHYRLAPHAGAFASAPSPLPPHIYVPTVSSAASAATQNDQSATSAATNGKPTPSSSAEIQALLRFGQEQRARAAAAEERAMHLQQELQLFQQQQQRGHAQQQQQQQFPHESALLSQSALLAATPMAQAGAFAGAHARVQYPHPAMLTSHHALLNPALMATHPSPAIDTIAHQPFMFAAEQQRRQRLIAAMEDMERMHQQQDGQTSNQASLGMSRR